LVDAVNPVVFVRPEEFGLQGTEGPEEVDGNPDLLRRLELVRAHAAVRMGIVPSPEEATRRSPGIPKLAWVGPPTAYRSIRGALVAAADVDLVGRILSMGKLHRAYALSGAACTAVAAQVEGTVVHEALRGMREEGRLRLGHPSGVLEVAASVAWRDGAWQVQKVTTYRTARRLMEGYALVPWSVWPG
jgi:2-methylaconitate cis-trans-isomerase PrpF